MPLKAHKYLFQQYLCNHYSREMECNSLITKTYKNYSRLRRNNIKMKQN